MYASTTSVPVERSKAEIERILMRYGATHFGYSTMPEGAAVQFVKNGKRIRFLLPLPLRPEEDESFFASKLKAWEQENRRLWRALALIVKGKLEAVESGIFTFEQEFLAHLVLPNGKTGGQFFIPQIEEAYRTGKVALMTWDG